VFHRLCRKHWAVCEGGGLQSMIEISHPGRWLDMWWFGFGDLMTWNKRGARWLMNSLRRVGERTFDVRLLCLSVHTSWLLYSMGTIEYSRRWWIGILGWLKMINWLMWHGFVICAIAIAVVVVVVIACSIHWWIENAGGGW
jgi:hypothetical protein